MSRLSLSITCAARAIVVMIIFSAAGCRIEPGLMPGPAGTGAAPGSGGAGGSGGTNVDVPAEPLPEAPDSDPVEAAEPLRELGQTCVAATECRSGHCAQGVCCHSACDGMCVSCAVPGLAGSCAKAPPGEDPGNHCPAEPVASCGRVGGCDGMGRCQMYPTGTECSSASCAAGVETGPGRCVGNGMCMPGNPRPCQLNECSGGRCLQGCSPTAPCQMHFTCVNGRCQGNGPVLHLRFDEESGAVANDSSGNGFAAAYVGMDRPPEPSLETPPTSFANPRSRVFPASGRPAVHLAATAPLLKPSNDLTVTLWYRASSALAGGSDLLNAGSDYLVRIKPAELEFAKRVGTTAGQVYAVGRATALTEHLDGRWHHVAGVSTPAGMRLYLDGNLRASNARGENLLYTGNDLWIARDGASSRDYVGAIDDVRVYNRALSATEIAALAAGGP